MEDEIAIMEQEAATAARIGDGAAHSAVHQGNCRANHLRGARLQRDQSELGRVGARHRSTISNRSSPTPRSARCVNGENEIVPRVSDLHSLYASTAGKIELEYVGEDKKEDDLIERLINRAVLKVFDRYFKVDDPQPTSPTISRADGASRSPTARRRPITSSPARGPGLARSDRSARPVRDPRPDGGGERAHLRGPASASEAQQGSPGRTVLLPRLRRRQARWATILRYTQWDGTQQLKLDADKVFEKLAEYLSYTDDVRQAMDWMMRQGMDFDGMRVMGLDEFLEQLRQEMRQRYREFNLKNALSRDGAAARGHPRSRARDAGSG